MGKPAAIGPVTDEVGVSHVEPDHQHASAGRAWVRHVMFLPLSVTPGSEPAVRNTSLTATVVLLLSDRIAASAIARAQRSSSSVAPADFSPAGTLRDRIGTKTGHPRLRHQ